MAFHYSPKIVTDDLVLYLDTANTKSFINTTIGWEDLTGKYEALKMSGSTYVNEVSGAINFNALPGSSASTTVSFISNKEMSWDVWFNRTSSTNLFNMVFSHIGLPYLAFRSSANDNKLLFSWAATGQQLLSSPLPGLDNTWYNVVCTLIQDTVATTSTAKMYVNGVLVSTTTTGVGTVTSVVPTDKLRIANYTNAGTYPFNGKISNLKVYNKILTAPDILQNFNALKSRFGL
jgi:hypothetical protein